MMFDERLAGRAVRFFENLVHTDGQFYGQPFILLPWERQIIWDVYGTLKPDGTRQYKYVYLEIPKKNGKSQLASGAALYHLYADGEKFGEVYSCAADKKQASIVYKSAKRTVQMIPVLTERSRIADSIKVIEDKKSGTVYEVLSAEAFTKHGFKISACIFDELHAQPNRDLYDVMTYEAGSTRRQPIWLFITTAGDDPDRVSICWEVHEYALKVLSGEIVDPTWYVVIYNYEGDDIYNEENWYKANPSLGVAKSIESMREAAIMAKNNPANERLFRWLDLNQWITTKLTTWLPLKLFDETVGNWNRMDLVGRACYMGLDLSATTDLSALALIFPPQGDQMDWRVIWESWIPGDNMEDRIKIDHVPYDKWAKGGWITPTDGNVIDYSVIENKVLELVKLYNIIELCADQAMATMLLQRLEKFGITVVNVPQTFVGLSDALNLTEILLKGKPAIAEPVKIEKTGEPKEGEEIKLIQGDILRGNMTHEANPVARWCFGNTSVAKNGQGYLKYVKEHKGKSVDRTKRIDLVAAWITAMARARFYISRGSVYEDRGLIVL